MDDDTTFDERVNEVRERRRRDPVGGDDITGLSALDEVAAGQAHPLGTDPIGQPDFRTGDSDDEIEQLRRDISRLEGKVDALLAALEIEDDDQ